MDLNVTNTLQQLLETHSVFTKIENEVLVSGNMSASAWLFKKPSTNISNLLQLDIRVQSPLLGKRTLIESFAGWGHDERLAVNSAWGKFAASSLHVLLEVFIHNNGTDNQVEWETWEENEKRWRVCMGPLFTMSFSEHNLPDLRCGDLIDRLRDTLLPRISQESHWLRLYYMRNGDSRVGSECLFDNEVWPEGQNFVDQWHWPDGSYAVRFFLIMLPEVLQPK